MLTLKVLKRFNPTCLIIYQELFESASGIPLFLLVDSIPDLQGTLSKSGRRLLATFNRVLLKSLETCTVPKVVGKFRYIERVALVQSNIERIFPFTYFPSCECEFSVANGIFNSSEKYSVLCM
jgi:hypothetical protein